MKYVKITRSDAAGKYVLPITEVLSTIDAELIDTFDDADPGTSITLEIVEMPEEQYEALPELVGW